MPFLSYMVLSVPRLLPPALLLTGTFTLTLAQTRPAPSTAPATHPATQPSQDAADAILDRLLGQPPTRPATSPADVSQAPASMARDLDQSSGSGGEAVAPDTRPQRLVREGSFVVDRTGRVRPSHDGRGLELVFASDGSNPSSAGDPPMLLVPSTNLMAIESAIREDPDRSFRVTGRVTEYRGRNHLLLEKVVVLR